jgi:hypothetical protein
MVTFSIVLPTAPSFLHDIHNISTVVTPSVPATGFDVPLPFSTMAGLTETTSSATAAAATSTIVSSLGSAADTATGWNGDGGGGGDGECRLLGPFALFVQLGLGALALLSLVYKRWRERPQRPLKIWFFDVSKQVFGSVLVHIANVFMSMLTSGRFSITLEPTSVQAATKLLRRGDTPYVPNPCSFYLLNLAIDVSTIALRHCSHSCMTSSKLILVLFY